MEIFWNLCVYKNFTVFKQSSSYSDPIYTVSIQHQYFTIFFTWLRMHILLVFHQVKIFHWPFLLVEFTSHSQVLELGRKAADIMHRALDCDKKDLDSSVDFATRKLSNLKQIS